MQPKDLFLAPIYLYQGKKLKRTALRLPEAEGERHGKLLLTSHLSKNNHSKVADKPSKTDSTMHLMIVGDSSAAGVGVEHQQDALIGHLLDNFKASDVLKRQFSDIQWSLHATSGHTSFDVLRRLYVLPKSAHPIDIMVVIVGVNDTTTNVSISQWRQQLQDIILLARRKFNTKRIVFSCLPPMAMMPALPKPLNHFMGAKAETMDNILQNVCQMHDDVDYLSIDFSVTELDKDELFATDGFHPSHLAYKYWAEELNNMIEIIVKQSI